MIKNSAVRGIGGFLRKSMAVAIGAATLAVAGGPAVAADDSGYKLRQARLCDTSGCYLAWNVVDSDHDGVSDADELMAHTDPFDPLSRPPLSRIAELAEKNLLSSFEAGLGAFFVFPPELQAAIEKSKGVTGLFAAFPLTAGQPDGLARLGISAELLKEHGIDANKQGLTIGLDVGAKGKGPEKKVGGIDMSLISAGEGDDDLAPLSHDVHGYKVKDETLDGDRFITYEDGCVRAEWADGSVTEMDKNGYVIGRGYINPDADTGSTVPTPEQEKNVLRLRGAVIRTINGWFAPSSEGAPPEDPKQTIILVDPRNTEDTAVVFDPPSVTKAQPETRPDLPSPGMPASGMGKPGCLGC
jgi:hypothetical protein